MRRSGVRIPSAPPIILVRLVRSASPIEPAGRERPAASGRTDELVRLLTKDAISVGDGGGKVPARTQAFEGAVAVAKFLWAMFQPAEAKRAIVGGPPEIFAWAATGEPAVVAVVEGRVVAIMCLEVTPEGIAACRTQANPDKLGRATGRWAEADHGGPLLVL